jgi:hypothetical protein
LVQLDTGAQVVNPTYRHVSVDIADCKSPIERGYLTRQRSIGIARDLNVAVSIDVNIAAKSLPGVPD